MKEIGIIGSRDYKRTYNYYDVVEFLAAKAVDLFTDYEKTGLKNIDGIIIPGGVDVNPALYSEENTDSVNIDDDLDRLEMRIIAEAVEKRIPILGSCRGHQILNVFFGGSLIQNVEHTDVHKAIGTIDRTHETNVDKDSFIYRIYNSEIVSVNSAHHQAVKKLGKNLRPVQWSGDGLIEAVCHESLPIFSVQWHPERMCLKNKRNDTVDGIKIFEYFMEQI